MAVQQLSFLGINRAVTDYSNTSACEELINLRPTTNGLVPVKPFSVKMAELPSSYKKIITHNTTNGVNYLCYKVTAEDNHYRCEVWQVDENGQPVGSTYLTYFYCETEEDYKDISFASVGNILFFSAIGSFPQNTELFWDGAEYKKREADIPDITPTISKVRTDLLISSVTAGSISSSSTRAEIIRNIENAINAIQEENKEYCFGPTIIAMAFKTSDGKSFWTSKWFVYDPTRDINVDLAGGSFYVTRNDFPSVTDPEFIAFFNKYGYAYTVTNFGYYRMGGVKVSVTIPQVLDWNKETSILKSVEIYTSRPALYVSSSEFYAESGGTSFLTINAPVKYQEMDLGNQLLYLQKSIPLEELAENPVTFNLQFGGNLQMTNETLRTDAGAVTRHGKLLAYNSRFHFFDSIAEVIINMPSFVHPETETTRYPADIFVLFNDGLKDKMLWVGTTNMSYTQPPELVISPDVRVKEVIAQIYVQAGGSSFYEYVSWAMTGSSRYNYSFGDGITSITVDNRRYNPYEYQSLIRINEPSAINVSEQYNPFVFDVNHSYLAPGKVLDVQPQMVAVKDVSFGDYPLNVFTDRGVYALLQGSGTVLYEGFKSISNLIASGGGRIPTESGTFFIAAGGLWAIAGDSAILVSDALSLGPHKFIRSNSGYQAISNQAYDVSDLVSGPTFEKYVDGASLSYNRHRDELIISNTAYTYSYVLSLKYRQWFKIGGVIHQDNSGSTLAWVGRSIVDFSDEVEFVEQDKPTSILVHLQSRPFSFNGYMYSHIHRIVAMVRSALSIQELLIAAIYGSDDLQNWTLLSYAGRSSKDASKRLEISQLRTPPAARSWRYYTICIGGRVPYDTDFGPVLVDYQPVIRRLG